MSNSAVQSKLNVMAARKITVRAGTRSTGIGMRSLVHVHCTDVTRKLKVTTSEIGASASETLLVVICPSTSR